MLVNRSLNVRIKKVLIKKECILYHINKVFRVAESVSNVRTSSTIFFKADRTSG